MGCTLYQNRKYLGAWVYFEVKAREIWQVSVNLKKIKLDDGSSIDYLQAIPDSASAAAILHFCWEYNNPTLSDLILSGVQ